MWVDSAADVAAVAALSMVGWLDGRLGVVDGFATALTTTAPRCHPQSIQYVHLSKDERERERERRD